MLETIDLGFAGVPGVIAAGLVEAPDGLVLVDPGPASTLGEVRAALARRGAELADVRAILVTHIHLDHSGGVGTLVREQPTLDVFVHERGAPHVVDPSKLTASAARLWGDQMGDFWGPVLPVPADRVRALRGGEALSVAGLDLRVADTPGHAIHHLSFLDTASGTACVGDVGGIRVGTPLFVVPPTPPPDIDIAAWDASLDAIRAWRPVRLFVTHFGAYADPEPHLADLQVRLHAHAEVVRRLLDDPLLDEAGRAASFARHMTGTFEEGLPDAEWVRRYSTAVPMDHCWHGLARYWRKRLA